MPLTNNCNSKKYAKRFSPQKTCFILFSAVIWAVFTISCNNPSETVRLRAKYNAMVDSAQHLFDVDKKDNAFKYLISTPIPQRYLNLNNGLIIML
jgi:hypothetical protein